jgi:hypothetical protein
MEFKTDIFSLEPNGNRTVSLIGATLPTSKDVYFRAKQKELLNQYAAARIFMQETETDDWSHWFNPTEDPKNQKAFELIFKSYFYETALIYYNIVVDLSWTICYLAAEFALSLGGKRVDLDGVMPIEDAYKLMRSAENNVTNPNANESPFVYLKNMCPDFATAIDMIVSFWNDFGCSEIRKMYNFCKHKGKPAYSEIEALRGGKAMGFYMQVRGETKVQLPSDIRDVQLTCSLADSIDELMAFDDEKLFPYISALLIELERVLKPSPFVF